VSLSDGTGDFGAPSLAGRESSSAHESTDTNHLVIVDKQGNWVSMTHTVYGSTFGTGLTVDGVGVNSGNTFQGVGVANGRRVITPFPALMALDDEGKPWLAIGSPGLSSRAVALTLINLIGYGMDPYASVDAPRFRGYGPSDALQVESRIPKEVVDGLAGFGVRVDLSAPYNWHMGSIQLIVRDRETGELVGVADPRRAGHAAGY
jgi:gamma-glutamyltranspeptidase/glutathione hydrolase